MPIMSVRIVTRGAYARPDDAGAKDPARDEILVYRLKRLGAGGGFQAGVYDGELFLLLLRALGRLFLRLLLSNLLEGINDGRPDLGNLLLNILSGAFQTAPEVFYRNPFACVRLLSIGRVRCTSYHRTQSQHQHPYDYSRCVHNPPFFLIEGHYTIGQS